MLNSKNNCVNTWLDTRPLDISGPLGYWFYCSVRLVTYSIILTFIFFFNEISSVEPRRFKNTEDVRGNLFLGLPCTMRKLTQVINYLHYFLLHATYKTEVRKPKFLKKKNFPCGLQSVIILLLKTNRWMCFKRTPEPSTR